MIAKSLLKGILLFSIISFALVGAASAGEKKDTKISKQEAQQLALEHQTNGSNFDDAGKFKEAIEEYQKSLEYVSDDANTLFNLGVVYLKANKAEDAAATFEKLIKVSRDDAEGYNLLGIAYRGCGKEKEAKAAWGKSLKINPDQPKVKEMMNDKVATTQQQ